MEIPSFSVLRISIASSSESMDASKATIYFGYGSNLWRHQMRQRCPTSKYLGIARLKGYRWIIYDRGYANIVEEAEQADHKEYDYTHECWGLVYTLQRKDEERLDVNEGVPVAYKKEWIECEFWPSSENAADAAAAENEENTTFRWSNGKPDTSKDPKRVDMLVYINRDMTKETPPKEEYIYRMNMGIRDAVKEGMPEAYVEQVIRQFIPDKEDEEVREVARRQALEFEDET
ncbi:Hypothetical predicted protein [Lecanosticta acicola]|uniref:gamma-glutamylcyclotransferase n=1 Tax=Lecanosticta acicola TaxID=111012 RepID=A0AAI9ED85_9PEZI|nr:Hypothetical predicted protein [Lecanosticta acicola]